ncbi:hypothetical protein CCP3SC1_30040 [Gammaproteobacteria bacterium]
MNRFPYYFRRGRIFVFLMVWLCIFVLPSAGVMAGGSPLAGRIVLAVIYAVPDEHMPGEFTEIIQGIQSRSDVLVLKLAINDQATNLSASIRATSDDKFESAEQSDHNPEGDAKSTVSDGNSQIAVIYPDISEPYRNVFTKIIEGIEAQTNSSVLSVAVGKGMNLIELKDLLRHQDVRVVIALGRQGMQIAEIINKEFGIVVGGVVTAPEKDISNLSVITLSPDPALLFSKLKTLMPGIARVFTVYDPRQNEWLLKLARTAANEQSLELVATEAADLKNAVHAYQSILSSLNNRTDALWLPQDPTTVEEGVILPMVLQEAWNRNLTVFSSNVGHVSRGALFSLYPDNWEMGRNLAGSALSFLSSGRYAVQGVVPLSNLLTAVNLRTARHLGLGITNQQQRYFDLVFPEP